MTLKQLSAGSPSTAQAWETGKLPQRQRWSGIAERLGLSEAFVFSGTPAMEKDYDFIETHADAIGYPPEYQRPVFASTHRVSGETERYEAWVERLGVSRQLLTSGKPADDNDRDWIRTHLAAGSQEISEDEPLPAEWESGQRRARIHIWARDDLLLLEKVASRRESTRDPGEENQPLATRQDCEELVATYLDAAEADPDPNALPFAYKTIRKHLRPEDFDTA